MNDFSLMASHLKIMNKRMVLLNPVSIKINFKLTNLYLTYRNSSQNNKMVKEKSIKKMRLLPKVWFKIKMVKWKNLNNNKKMNNKIFKLKVIKLMMNRIYLSRILLQLEQTKMMT